MSGIGAILHLDDRPVARDAISRVARSLALYGPEYQQATLAGRCGLAYAHLTNVPEARSDDQPRQAADGQLIGVFDGRLDNRAELAALLGLPPPDASLLSDSQLAMQSIERFGEAAISRWAGEFAIIVWNRQASRLFAAVDPLGQRTLSYHVSHDRLVLASSPRGVFAAGGIERRPDKVKIAAALLHAYSDGSRSFFMDIKRLCGGRQLTASSGEPVVSRHWSIKDIADVRLSSDCAYAEAGLEIFDRAVGSLMRTQGKVGAFMSGGLDSPAVAVSAARALPSGQTMLPTFTWVPEPGWDGRIEPHRHGNERPFVDAIAAMEPRISPALVNAEGLGLYHRLDEFLDFAEVPPRNALNLSWIHAILAEASRRGITAMLGGERGNMTVSWAGTDNFRRWFKAGRWTKLLQELWLCSGRQPRQAAGLAYRQLLKPGISEPAEWLGAISRSGLIDPPKQVHLARAVCSRSVSANGDSLPVHPNALSCREQRYQMLTAGLASEAGGLQQAFRAMYGIELRDPMADRRVVEWALGIPPDQFLGQGQQRWLIKRMMHGRLPQTVLRNQSKGRQCADWLVRLTRDLPDMRRDIETLSEDTDAAELIDLDRIAALLDDWPKTTIIDPNDDRRTLMPVSLPATLAIGRFMRRNRGANR